MHAFPPVPENAQSFKATELHQLRSFRAFLSPPTHPSEEDRSDLESWLIGRGMEEDLDREWLGGMS